MAGGVWKGLTCDLCVRAQVFNALSEELSGADCIVFDDEDLNPDDDESARVPDTSGVFEGAVESVAVVSAVRTSHHSLIIAALTGGRGACGKNSSTIALITDGRGCAAGTAAASDSPSGSDSGSPSPTTVSP